MAAYWAEQSAALDHPAVKALTERTQGAPCGRCWACRATDDVPLTAVVEAAVTWQAARTSGTGLVYGYNRVMESLGRAVDELLAAPACVDLTVPAVSVAETAAEDQAPECPGCGRLHHPWCQPYGGVSITRAGLAAAAADEQPAGSGS